MTVYYANPAVQFDWPAPTESDAPLVARRYGDASEPVPVDDPGVVAALSAALDGATREELAERLAASTGLDADAAADRVADLVAAEVLVPDGPTTRDARAWLEHGWRQSLYYHLATRHWTPATDAGEAAIDHRRPAADAGDAADAADTGEAADAADAGDAADVGETVDAGVGTASGHGRDRHLPDDAIPLPEPTGLPDRPLDEVLFDRRTCREFDGTPMDYRDLSVLLDAALRPSRTARGFGVAGAGPASRPGVTRPYAVRPVVARSPNLDPGTYRYLVDEHALLPVDADGVERSDARDGDAGATSEAVDAAIRESVVDQPFVDGGAVTLLVTTDLAAYRRLQPDQGSLRYLFADASCIVHRLIIAATTLGFDCFQSAAFDDDRAAAVAGTDPVEEPVSYLLTVGTEVER